jgi:transcriptional regulator with XRE-family HTH domain
MITGMGDETPKVTGKKHASVGRPVNGATAYLGKMLTRERMKAHWTIAELAARMGVNAGHLGRIESGYRAMSEAIALKAGEIFTDTDFYGYYLESQTWLPAGFRDWGPHEDKTTRLYIWTPGAIDGVAQTEAYARATLETYPDVPTDVVDQRLANRMARQQRILQRRDLLVWLIVDHASLYRFTGNAQVMTGQMGQLATLAAFPNVMLQVMPAIAHPANQSSLMLADSAAYAEHALSGHTYTEPDRRRQVGRLFDMLRAESYGVTESRAIVRKAGETWTGERAVTAEPTADSASKPRRKRGPS